MEIFAPKDGFVVALHVRSGAQVQISDPLVTMDSDNEERDKARLAKMEAVRALMAAQYEGSELKLNQRLVEIAYETAKAVREGLESVLKSRHDDVLVGQNTQEEYLKATSAHRQAALAEEKARLDLKKFQFAVTRHLSINREVQMYMKRERELLSIKTERLTVKAPVSGKASLRVAVNSFAELGSVLLEIG